MYAPQAEQKAEKISRCYILPKVGAKWQHLSEKCAPTVEQACDFEKVNVTDMQGDPADPYDHDLPKEFGESKGWKWMGGGRGRETFQFKPGCVVKFARSDRVNGRVVGARPWEGGISAAQAEGKHLTGTEQNTYEVATFNSCNESVKELMVPIIAHSPKPQYKWLVLPTARVRGDGLTPRIDWYEVVDYLESELPNRNATVVDLHEGNVGKLEGNPVLVDYGFRTTCPPSKRTDKTIAKKLSEFIPEQKVTPVCIGNYDCKWDEACVDDKCKKPSKLDIDDEIHRVILMAQLLPTAKEAKMRAEMIREFARVRTMQKDGEYIRAIDTLNELKKRIRLAKVQTPRILKSSESESPASTEVINAMQRAVKDFDLRDYPSQAGRDFDELLNKAEHAKNKGLYDQAMRYVELARGQMKSKKTGGLVPPKTRVTKHKGRHGLKRPRGGAMGELTRKRRVLWARAGELRRKAKKLPASANKREMVDEARFLEQQAWHYQTKQMKSGKAPLSDPFRMMAILKPEQRSYFPDLKLQMDKEYGSRPSTQTHLGMYETPPEEA